MSTGHISPPPKKNAVKIYLKSDFLAEPLEFIGEPIYYKWNGIYGYLMPCFDKVVFFCSSADGVLYYNELKYWSVTK